MATIQYPLVNGKRYSFASIECTVNGTNYLGFKGINYDDSLKPTPMYGTTSVPLGRTRGKYEAKGDIEVYRLEFNDIVQNLAQNGVGFGEASFDFTIVWSEQNDDGSLGPVTTDQIFGVRLESAASSNSEGTDPSSIKLTMNIIQPILWNGVSIVTPLQVSG